MNRNARAWERYGEEYQSCCVCSDEDFHYALCVAGEQEYRILPDICDATICDIGSGTGENAAYLARYAKYVVGIEPTENFFIRSAERYRSQKNLVFRCTDFLGFDLSEIGHQKFDLVTFIQSLDYMVLNGDFFVKLNEMTMIGSRIVISRMHPMWTTLFDHELDEMKLSKHYFEERVDSVSYGSGSFRRVHYSIQELLERFSKNGWCLEMLKEPAPVPKERAALVMGRCYDDVLLMERMSKYPMTLLLRFERRA